MPKYDSSNTPLPSNSELPRGRYIARILEIDHAGPDSEKFKEKGWEMTTLNCEIVSPETVAHPSGQDIPVAGRQFSYWLMWGPETWGAGRSRSALARLLGQDPAEFSIDTDDTEGYKELLQNKHFYCILGSEKDVKRMQKQPGEKVGKPIKDELGKEISLGYRITAQVDDIDRPAPEIIAARF